MKAEFHSRKTNRAKECLHILCQNKQEVGPTTVPGQPWSVATCEKYINSTPKKTRRMATPYSHTPRPTLERSYMCESNQVIWNHKQALWTKAATRYQTHKSWQANKLATDGLNSMASLIPEKEPSRPPLAKDSD